MERRPWGSFRVLTEGDGYKVKELFIERDGMTSLQYHKHREEYWIIVKGSGTVIIGDSERVVREGDFIFVPKGVKHRIIGGNEGLLLIEIWKGDILDENDIVRLDDKYGRV